MWQFLDRALPDPRTVRVLGPILLAAALAASRWVGWLRARKGIRTPYTRKLFHFVIFTTAGLLQLVAGLEAVMLRRHRQPDRPALGLAR